MEHTLKCNVLKCRKELSDQALVTTCSHIFCTECSNNHGLTGQVQERHRTCPACRSQIINPDDAVVTHLNLSEDYKTTILSGLSPNVIMECAGRALSFWAYQTTQEIVYQRYLEKTLTEKLKSLDMRFQRNVDDANTEIIMLANIPAALSDNCDNERRKHEELAYAYQEKSRKLTQIQELYDRVKRKADLGQMEAAAIDAIESSLRYGTYAPDSDLPGPTTRLNIYEPQREPVNHDPFHSIGQ
ncbi:E3 ubiquitin-protein ligase CCNB1IP1, partial [Colletotrichum navitas]